jgi:hypothetical protein
MDTYENNCKHARDLILAEIIGMQNETGYYANFKKYQTFQEVYDKIVEKHGDMFEDWQE